MSVRLNTVEIISTAHYAYEAVDYINGNKITFESMLTGYLFTEKLMTFGEK
jgi:hypothetical protein